MKHKAGQTLLETCIVMMLLCLIFFGLIQLSQLSASKEILDYAASCGARARSVGFNDFMVGKVVRVAAIPNAGRLLTPEVIHPANPAALSRTPGAAWDYALAAQPASPQFPVESHAIPLYLGGDSWGRLPAILDYEYWNSSTDSRGAIELHPARFRRVGTRRPHVPGSPALDTPSPPDLCRGLLPSGR